jgi:hypothetical protein
MGCRVLSDLLSPRHVLCVNHHRLGCYRLGCYQWGCYRLNGIGGGHQFGCSRLVPVAGCHHRRSSIGWVVLGGGRQFGCYRLVPAAGCHRRGSQFVRHPCRICTSSCVENSRHHHHHVIHLSSKSSTAAALLSTIFLTPYTCHQHYFPTMRLSYWAGVVSIVIISTKKHRKE